MLYAQYEKIGNTYAKNKIQSAEWDDGLFKELDSLLGSLVKNTLVFIGDPGCGKTANICLMHDLYQTEELAGFLYLPYFCKIFPGSDDIDYMLDYFIYRAEKAAGLDCPDNQRIVHPDWGEKIDLRAMGFESKMIYLINTVNALEYYPVILAIDDFDKLDHVKQKIFFAEMRSLMPQKMHLLLTMRTEPAYPVAGKRTSVYTKIAEKGSLLSERALAVSFMERGNAALGHFFEVHDEAEALSNFEEAAGRYLASFKTTRDPHDFFRHAEALVKIGMAQIHSDREKACAKLEEAKKLTFLPSQSLPCPEMKYTTALLHFGLGLAYRDKPYAPFEHFQEAAGRIAQMESTDHMTVVYNELASLVYGHFGSFRPMYREKADDSLRELYKETENLMYKERIGKPLYEMTSP